MHQLAGRSGCLKWNGSTWKTKGWNISWEKPIGPGRWDGSLVVSKLDQLDMMNKMKPNDPMEAEFYNGKPFIVDRFFYDKLLILLQKIPNIISLALVY
jgi:hypothetical protein